MLATGSVVGLVALALSVAMMAFAGSASSAAGAVNLGTAQSFGVLAGSAVTNTGSSLISGDLGVSPAAAVSGFPPGQVLGTIHAADATAAAAQADLTTAYNAAAAQPATETISADLAGRTLTTGVFNSASSLGLSGELTLDAQGDAGAVFIFQAGSTLTTSSGSNVRLINGAQACNVFWQVGSSATLGTSSTFRGNVLALTSITAQTGATIAGRLLARNGAVTLDDNTVTPSSCLAPSTGVPSTGVPSTGVPSTGVPSTGGSSTGGSGSDGSGSDGSGSDVPTTDGPAAGLPSPEGPEGSGQRQISTVPRGAPDTGDGGSVRTSSPWLLGAGVLALGLTAAVVVRRHRTSSGS